MECDKIILDEVKEAVRKEYIDRLRVILKESISAKNTITSIGAYAMPVLRYGFGALRWTQAELQGLDTKTRKVLAKTNFHHECSDVHIIYFYR